MAVNLGEEGFASCGSDGLVVLWKVSGIFLDDEVSKLHSLGFGSGRYLIDENLPNQSEHLVFHFHKLCYQAIREWHLDFRSVLL